MKRKPKPKKPAPKKKAAPRPFAEPGAARPGSLNSRLPSSSDGSPSSEKPNGKPPSAASTTAKLSDRLRGLVPQSAKPALKPTGEQQAIVEAFQELLAQGGGVLIAEAGAGTGKTSLLKIIAETVNRFGQFTAFNTALVAESKEKFRDTKVACNTTHSLAFLDTATLSEVMPGKDLYDHG